MELWFKKGFGSIPFFSSEINSLEVGDSSQNLKKIFRITVSLWQSTSKIPDKSLPISNTNGSLKLIFYSFEVLTSTSELQSMSFVRPLVMEIESDNWIRSSNLVHLVSQKPDHAGSGRDSENSLWTKPITEAIFMSSDPLKLILSRSVVLMSTLKL